MIAYEASATVEIAHTYAPNRLLRSMPGEGGQTPQLVDTIEAAHLRALAQMMGKNVIRLAFIDDVVIREEQRKSLDSWRLQMFINPTQHTVMVGAGTNNIYFESNFAEPARKLVANIRGMNLPDDYRLNESGTAVVYGSGKNKLKLPLVGFKGIADPEHPSCQMLDVAWLQKRLEIAPAAFTILPQEYETQQRQVELLARLLPSMQFARVSSVYVDADSKEVSRRSWF